MLIEKVKQLAPLERFLYWVRERNRIYELREAGKPKPWTDDEVMQRVFFTNPYRENDKTTKWFFENFRGLYYHDPAVFFGTVCFRWFNRIETGLTLLGEPHTKGRNLLIDWNEHVAVRRLRDLNERQPVFTGAFMIKVGNGPPGCKIPHVCEVLSSVWERRQEVTDGNWPDLQSLWKWLKQFPGLGGFMAYEIVSDLRYTYLLENATDVDTWANPGPGCMRGLARLEGVTPGKKIRVRNPLGKMQELLKIMRKKLKTMPHFEMRETEHSLCEFDKMERALFKQGRIKRNYSGT